jgi:hypothetical protein
LLVITSLVDAASTVLMAESGAVAVPKRMVRIDELFA